MATKPIIISGDVIGESDLRAFVADVERLTGARVTIIPQWVVASDNPAIELALQSLFAHVPLKPLTRREKPVRFGGGEKKPAFRLLPTPEQSLKGWRVLDDAGQPTEKLTNVEKNRRLAQGEFDEGARLHHPKYGKQVVVGARGSEQRLEDTK